jgi:hypothetical protein
MLERVRQLGSNKQGAKGSYTIYRLAEAAKCRKPQLAVAFGGAYRYDDVLV